MTFSFNLSNIPRSWGHHHPFYDFIDEEAVPRSTIYLWPQTRQRLKQSLSIELAVTDISYVPFHHTMLRVHTAGSQA